MPKREHEERAMPQVVRGVLLEYNISPRGSIEGMLVQQGERVVQVNFPHEAAVALAAVGQEVTIACEPEAARPHHPPGDHPVYRAVCDVKEPKRAETTRVAGVVRRLNFARHGEANGVVLENGDFVHLKPEGMKKAPLAVGQAVEAEGKARPMLLGGRVLEAEVVNGVAVRG